MKSIISNLFLSILRRNIKNDKNLANAIKDADDSLVETRKNIEDRLGDDKEKIKRAIPQSVREYLGFDY
jgi:hypothetical protein